MKWILVTHYIEIYFLSYFYLVLLWLGIVQYYVNYETRIDLNKLGSCRISPVWMVFFFLNWYLQLIFDKVVSLNQSIKYQYRKINVIAECFFSLVLLFINIIKLHIIIQHLLSRNWCEIRLTLRCLQVFKPSSVKKSENK